MSICHNKTRDESCSKNPNWKNGIKRYAKFISSAKRQNRPCDIDAEYLAQIYKQQKGICPFTGIHMTLPTDSTGGINGDPYKASLDRINNDLGYIRGNVRFVSHMANIARGAYSDEELIEFCVTVAKYRK